MCTELLWSFTELLSPCPACPFKSPRYIFSSDIIHFLISIEQQKITWNPGLKSWYIANAPHSESTGQGLVLSSFTAELDHSVFDYDIGKLSVVNQIEMIVCICRCFSVISRAVDYNCLLCSFCNWLCNPGCHFVAGFAIHLPFCSWLQFYPSSG